MRSGTISVLDAGSIAWTSEAMQNCTGIVARLNLHFFTFHWKCRVYWCLRPSAGRAVAAMPTIQASFDDCGYGGHILPCGMVPAVSTCRSSKPGTTAVHRLRCFLATRETQPCNLKVHGGSIELMADNLWQTSFFYVSFHFFH